jgi:hypothetical protein
MTTHAANVTLNYMKELQDRTVHCSSGRRRIAGLKDWNAEIEILQDFASSNIDKFFFTALGTSQRLFIRPKSTAIGAANPLFHGNCMWGEYAPIAAPVGEVAKFTLSVQGNGNLKRSVTTT